MSVEQRCALVATDVAEAIAVDALCGIERAESSEQESSVAEEVAPGGELVAAGEVTPGGELVAGEVTPPWRATKDSVLLTASRGDARRALKRAAGEMTGLGETGRQLKRKIAHGLPADLRWDDVCHGYLRGNCGRRKCSKLHWERSTCSDWLASRDLLTPQAVYALSELGIQTINDLAAMFLTREEAEEKGLGKQWAVASFGAEARAARSAEAAVKAQKVAVKAARKPKFLEPTTKMLPRSRIPSKQWPSGEKARETYKRVLFRRHPHKAVITDKAKMATSPSADGEARREVAEEMAELASSWAPRAGPSKGVTDQEVIDQRARRLAIRLVARCCEIQTMRSAQRTWMKFVEFCKEYEIPEHEAVDHDITDFAYKGKDVGKVAPTTPMARRDASRRMARNLLAMPEPSADARPPRHVGDYIAKEPKQAAKAEPETLLKLESLVSGMIQLCPRRRRIVPVLGWVQ